jgi:hypothetical protein
MICPIAVYTTGIGVFLAWLSASGADIIFIFQAALTNDLAFRV